MSLPSPTASRHGRRGFFCFGVGALCVVAGFAFVSAEQRRAEARVVALAGELQAAEEAQGSLAAQVTEARKVQLHLKAATLAATGMTDERRLGMALSRALRGIAACTPAGLEVRELRAQPDSRDGRLKVRIGGVAGGHALPETFRTTLLKDLNGPFRQQVAAQFERLEELNASAPAQPRIAFTMALSIGLTGAGEGEAR